PERLAPTTSSQLAIVWSRQKRTGLFRPALLTRMSIRLCRARMPCTTASTAAESRTSRTATSAEPPSLRIAETPRSSSSARRPDSTTCAPASASSCAPARPIPLPAPVTQATDPRSAIFVLREKDSTRIYADKRGKGKQKKEAGAEQRRIPAQRRLRFLALARNDKNESASIRVRILFSVLPREPEVLDALVDAGDTA